MLEISDLSVTYPGAGAPAVADMSLSLPAGNVLAVLGPSGSGKSTLLRAVAGLEVPDTGAVRFDGEDVTRRPPHRRGFALLFQDGQLFGHLSVGDNVAYPLRLRRASRVERHERVEELLGLVGLEGYAGRAPAELSGGEQQRVALARALAVRPRLLLLDEPLSALDTDLRRRLAEDLRGILEAERTTALLVTHDHDEAFAVADLLAVVRDGRLVQSGTLDEVWRHPADPETARFLGYAGVVPADAARSLGVAGDGALAVRRSALRVSDDGALAGTVRSVRSTPEQIRLEVEIDQVGLLDAVAALDRGLRVGDRVRLAVDWTRTAPLAVSDR
jgi:thiamine transport system ATP-binding protein